MTRHERPTRSRCLAVWSAATGAAAVTLLWLLGGLSTASTFETALVDLMTTAGAGAILWLWVLTTLTTYDAARGRAERGRAAVPAFVRRVVLAACGVSLATGVLALPAQADDGHPRHPVLTGLPMPDRPTTLSTLGLAFRLAEATAHPHAQEQRAQEPRVQVPHAQQPPAPRSEVVREGDTLWAIAQRHLSPTASDDAIGRACARLYELNRAVIGDDPDLIHPGQRLRLPDLTQEDS